jgi:serine/threonine protein phosphatase PrpC
MTAKADQTTRSAPHMHFDAAMLTNVGVVRTHNEDVVLYAMPQDNGSAGEHGSLALVADGMGGHAAGEVASGLAAEIIRRVFYEVDGPVPVVLASAFAAANREILNWTKAHPECAGMGTTCTALALRGNEAWLAHIGDSRAYLLRGNALTQLSEDQTLVAELVREGKLTAEEAKNSPVSNVILQALGMAPEIGPIIWNKPLPLSAGDILILCTDGLSGLVSNAAIADIAGRLAPHEACNALIEAALGAGGHDNVSVGVIRVAAEAEQAAESGQTTRRMLIPDQAGNGMTRESADAQTRRIMSPFESNRPDG